jgi:hypothetical protein
MGGNERRQQSHQTKKQNYHSTKNAEFVTHDDPELSHKKLFDSYQFHGFSLRLNDYAIIVFKSAGRMPAIPKSSTVSP